jgi:uncharacterized UBP type Zn finger protein
MRAFRHKAVLHDLKSISHEEYTEQTLELFNKLDSNGDGVRCFLMSLAPTGSTHICLGCAECEPSHLLKTNKGCSRPN